jgi:hypothetical protein
MEDTRTLEELRERFPFNGGRGDRFPSGRPIDWPKCDLDGEIMEQEDREPHVGTFVCKSCGFELSFASCQYSDRYCAYVGIDESYSKW